MDLAGERVGSARVVVSDALNKLALIAVLTFVIISCTQTEGTARGPVTAVQGSLTDVTAFTVFSSGAELEFVPMGDQTYEFPLGHLREHLRTGEPVIVEWELRDDLRYALSVKDG
jgi:hypothetical protein